MNDFFISNTADVDYNSIRNRGFNGVILKSFVDLEKQIFAAKENKLEVYVKCGEKEPLEIQHLAIDDFKVYIKKERTDITLLLF